MSQENVEVVRRLFKASARSFETYWKRPRSLAAATESGDLPPETREMLGFIHPEATWKTVFAGLTFRGHLEMLRGWDQFLEVATDYRVSFGRPTTSAVTGSSPPWIALPRPSTPGWR
jgi:hypothetical protein